MRMPIVLAGLLTCVAQSCSSDDLPPQLDRAMQAAEQLTSEGWLERSTFFVVFPEGTPRQYVSFLFSDMGAAERPPVEGSGEFSSEDEAMLQRSFMPVWPAGVGMTHSKPDPELELQVVWKWDDARRMIILEGYSSAGSPPLVVREVPFPASVQPSKMARMVGESNRETGARAQSFE